MANRLLTAPRARLDAVLTGGRGTSSPWPTEAQGRAIKASLFRPTQGNVRLEDAGLSGQEWDRSYCWRWDSSADWDTPANAYQTQYRELALTLDVGYLAGRVAEVGGFVNVMAGTGETSTIALGDPRERALEDAEMVWTALSYPPLYQNGAPTADDITPAIAMVTRGQSALRDLSPTRLVCSTSLRVVITYPPGQMYP